MRVSLVLLMLLILASPCLAGTNKATAEFSDDAVLAAINKGVAYLWSIQREDGTWPMAAAGEHTYTMGTTALAVYALLEAGVDPQDPRMAKSLDWLKDANESKTYSLGMRANVWLTANKKLNNKYMEQLEKDVKILAASTARGSYGYDSKGDGKSGGDNSNSQYGLLGVWAGARANLEIDSQYWYKVINHWITTQCADGAWTYGGGGSESGTATMAAAGVASLFVCFDNLYAEAFEKCNATDKLELKSITRGLAWFDRNFEKTMKPGASLGIGDVTYYLYGVERVGLASGYKYFGAVDWYKMGASRLMSAQGGNGAWMSNHGGGPVGTSLSLLFLVRGRNSVLFNKLEYKGDWNNRPRALASLTSWISRNMEATVNWQIVTLKSPVADWHDAPILFFSGSKAPEFSDEDIDKLRTYVYQGGTLFTVSECEGTAFRKGMREVYAKLFPKWALTQAEKDNDINSVQFRLKDKPKFFIVHNGIRPLAIHVDEDLPLRWQTNRYVSDAWAFESALNLVMYSTDRGSLRARGTGLWPADAPQGGAAPIQVARLKHSGEYDAEPLAYTRFARMMALDGVNVQIGDPIDMKDLDSNNAKIALLSGLGKVTFSQAEHEAVEKFAATGGTLVIDAAGGSKEFAKAAEAMIGKIYGLNALRRLPNDSPILQVPGCDLNAVKYRRTAKVRLGNEKSVRLQCVMLNNRPAILYSREDIVSGLVGYPSLTCDGYAPQSAYNVLKAIVCSVGGAKPDAPATQPAAAEKQAK